MHISQKIKLYVELVISVLMMSLQLSGSDNTKRKSSQIQLPLMITVFQICFQYSNKYFLHKISNKNVKHMLTQIFFCVIQFNSRNNNNICDSHATIKCK